MLSWAFMDQVLNALWFWALGRGGPVLKSLACSGQTSCAPGRTRDAGLTWLLGVDRLGGCPQIAPAFSVVDLADLA